MTRRQIALTIIATCISGAVFGMAIGVYVVAGVGALRELGAS